MAESNCCSESPRVFVVITVEGMCDRHSREIKTLLSVLCQKALARLYREVVPLTTDGGTTGATH